MPAKQHSVGVSSALLAFMLWGLLPVFWKLLQHIDAFAVSAFRVLWAAVFLITYLLITGNKRKLIMVFGKWENLKSTLLASLFITGNFIVFIWAVSHNRVTEVSLGYYINPLVNVFTGWLFLKEKLTRVQWAGIFLATGGVGTMTWGQGQLPWVALLLAGCFSLYGLVRKTSPVDSMTGLTAETIVISPFCIAYLSFFIPDAWAINFTTGWQQTAIIMLTGPATAIPLFLFAYGAQRIPLSLVGMIMYITPTLHLLLAVLAYGEPFYPYHGVAFSLIWMGISLFIWQSLIRFRKVKRTTALADN